MNQRNNSTELSYYGLYLLSFLNENHPERLPDTDFIETRSALADDVYEQSRREGHAVEQAQELAMTALLKDLHFSKFNTLIEVLWNEFAEDVPPENAAEVAFKIQPSMNGVFSKYSLSDDFAYTNEYNALYSELTGAVLLYIEEHGI
ncbi:DUF1896 domain-containing protein [Paludibacter sp.]|uniref:DUF1896 domain-containing protein n=1 Tax=Paludibacter sp. TaxID=1898105 RepID=UPI001352317D|nr:DUF1896 domain-containing protein [Paludibacter sp.]MTK53340.1 DUF1896 domain-containing protein [Paludibacter sp.]